MKYKIPFNKAAELPNIYEHINKALTSGILCGDGPYMQKVHEWFSENICNAKVFMTPSCTAALEMSSVLIDIQPGDEVIMPSYTFSSTANAFCLRGAKIKFVDIRPDTLNIDETLIERAITNKTKAIVPVHYAGVSCDMKYINELAERYNIYIIEDAAQAIQSRCDGDYVGTQGHLSAFSFHETKNFTSGGEGGLISINDENFIERAEIIREKGTNRNKFFRGEVDKYTWVDIGSSYLPGELQAAHLYAQLENANSILEKRIGIWERYVENLAELERLEKIVLPYVPENCSHNAHMFYIKCENIADRTSLCEFLRKKGIYAVFHYIPLHSSTAGRIYGEFIGDDVYTTSESQRILRLPMYFDLTLDEVDYITQMICEYYTLYEL